MTPLSCPPDQILNLPYRIAQNCPGVPIPRGQEKSIPVNVVLGLPCDLELLGGLKNTKSLPLPIPRKAKGQMIFGVQNPSVSRLRREKDQPVNKDNAALIELCSLDDVISLPIHADLFSAEQCLLPSAHVTFSSHKHYFLCLSCCRYKAILNF